MHPSRFFRICLFSLLISIGSLVIIGADDPATTTTPEGTDKPAELAEEKPSGSEDAASGGEKDKEVTNEEMEKEVKECKTPKKVQTSKVPVNESDEAFYCKAMEQLLQDSKKGVKVGKKWSDVMKKRQRHRHATEVAANKGKKKESDKKSTTPTATTPAPTKA